MANSNIVLKHSLLLLVVSIFLHNSIIVQKMPKSNLDVLIENNEQANAS